MKGLLLKYAVQLYVNFIRKFLVLEIFLFIEIRKKVNVLPGYSKMNIKYYKYSY